MRILLLIAALASLVQADLNRALKILSRCQPETKFLDVSVSPRKDFDDADVEAQKEIIHHLHGLRFVLSGEKRFV